MLRVVNVKGHFNYVSKKDVLDNYVHKFAKDKAPPIFRSFNNIQVIRTEKLVFTILARQSVINVTKVKKIGDLTEAREEFALLLDIPTRLLSSPCIDNLTCCGDLGKELNLTLLARKINRDKEQSLTCQFDPGRFHAMTIHKPKEKGAAIIFASGKINILGVNELKKAENLFLQICVIIKDL